MITERLLIRKPKFEDGAPIYKIRNSEFVMKYNAMQDISLDEFQKELVQETDNEETFVMELKDTHKVIGIICVEKDRLRYKVNSLCLSYYLGENYTRKGYMKEALLEVIRYVFEDKQAEVLAVRAFQGNEASTRLIESLGFVYEGCIRKGVQGYGDIIYDDIVYSILKEEYSKH